MKDKIKVGTKLIAIDNFFCYQGSFLTRKKEYEVTAIGHHFIEVINDSGNHHSFARSAANDYFKLAEPSEPAYTLTEKQLKEIAENGERVKEMFPEVFPKTEIGKWYKFEPSGRIFFITRFDERGHAMGYGFDRSGKFTLDEDDSSDFVACNKEALKKCIPATDEEVTTALKKECVKRFGEDWRNVKIEKCMFREDSNSINRRLFAVTVTTNEVWSRNGCIFKDGKWAKPLKFTTISEVEAKIIVAEKYGTTPEQIQITK